MSWTLAHRISFFEALAQAYPNPKTELNYTNPYTLLVAVVLSAQTTDVSVNQATRDLFTWAHTPQDMLTLSLEELTEILKPVGLYRVKARYVLELSRRLIEVHNGNVPDCREKLQRLPGVGRKTANVVLNVAFGQETFPVDTHIFRVANRTGLACGKTPEQVEAKLEKMVPKPFRKTAHLALILHGRYTCTARSPKCSSCPVFEQCEWEWKMNPTRKVPKKEKT